MEFQVKRISQSFSEDKPPCEGAVLHEYLHSDRRTCDDPSKLPLPERDNWYKHGINHRVENGGIVRDIPRMGWFIEISDLETLMDFCRKYGEIIVYPGDIEIYDDYRE